MKTREIMIKNVTSLSPQMSAKEALDLLFEKKISGLPVIGQDGKLIGMFTEKEVLSYTLPSYIEQVGRFVYEDNPKSTKKKFADLDKVKVSQLMRKEVITTSEDTTLCEVARIMLINKARRLPVLDKAGKVIGIVTREDIIKAYAKEAGWRTG